MTTANIKDTAKVEDYADCANTVIQATGVVASSQMGYANGFYSSAGSAVYDNEEKLIAAINEILGENNGSNYMGYVQWSAASALIVISTAICVLPPTDAARGLLNGCELGCTSENGAAVGLRVFARSGGWQLVVQRVTKPEIDKNIQANCIFDDLQYTSGISPFTSLTYRRVWKKVPGQAQRPVSFALISAATAVSSTE